MNLDINMFYHLLGTGVIFIADISILLMLIYFGLWVLVSIDNMIDHFGINGLSKSVIDIIAMMIILANITTGMYYLHAGLCSVL